MNFKKITICFFILTVSFHVWADAPMNVKLKAKADVDVHNIRFEDIVDVASTDPRFIKQFGSYVFSLDDASDYIHPSDILTSLVRYGANLEDINLLSTEPIKVLKTSNAGIMDEVRYKLLQALSSKGVKFAGDKKMVVHDIENLPAPTLYQSIDLDVAQFDPSQSQSQALVRFLNKTGQLVYSSMVRISFETEFKVLVSKRNLLPGSNAAAGDFEEKIVSVKPASAVMNIQENTQFQVLNPIQAGQVLIEGDLSVSTKMNKGDMVTVLTGDKRFQVRTLGRVKDILDNGSSVVVENLESKKELIGKPLNSTEVQVIY
ncbi:flagella basal body P-ring formation protein FlgA [bacterium]|nr:flagella basal body P-ring formation protein FlgA [bacterium]